MTPNEMLSMIAQLRRERDEANYFLKELSEADGQLKVRMDELCKVLQKAERERDEARTTIEDAKRALNAIGYEGLLLAALRVKEERDEAREAGWKLAMQAVWDRLPMPAYANDPMEPREVAKLIEFVRSQKEETK